MLTRKKLWAKIHLERLIFKFYQPKITKTQHYMANFVKFKFGFFLTFSNFWHNSVQIFRVAFTQFRRYFSKTIRYSLYRCNFTQSIYMRMIVGSMTRHQMRWRWFFPMSICCFVLKQTFFWTLKTRFTDSQSITYFFQKCSKYCSFRDSKGTL